MTTCMPKPVNCTHTLLHEVMYKYILRSTCCTKKLQTSHPAREKVNSSDSVLARLQDVCVHQAVVITTGFVFLCVEATYHMNTGHHLVHDFICQSHGVVHCQGQPLGRKTKVFSVLSHGWVSYIRNVHRVICLLKDKSTFLLHKIK